MRSEVHSDAVVIGAGTAGLVAGARLAQGGARVCVLAKGVGSTPLAAGTIDVLGYAPGAGDAPGGAERACARRRPAVWRFRPPPPRRWRPPTRLWGSRSAWSAPACCATST